MSPNEKDLRDALDLVRMFYATKRPRDYRDRWKAITGSSEFTIRMLGAHIDAVLERSDP